MPRSQKACLILALLVICGWFALATKAAHDRTLQRLGESYNNGAYNGTTTDYYPPHE